MIPQGFIDEVQNRTDIVEIISSYIPMKKAGRNFKAACPFHGEKTPSFMVSPQKQIFHCFGCGEGGGVIQFIMLYEKSTFVEAIEILADRLGLKTPQQSGERGNLKGLLYKVVDEAALFFASNLILPHAKVVCDYLSERGIGPEVIKQFRLGFSGGRNSLISHMRQKNFTLDALSKASLAIFRNDSYRDLFRDRIMFPICDVRSRVVGFGARIYGRNDKAPKYINSLENPLYSKREHLYGLNLSKDEISKKDSVIVTEGYLDMIVPFIHGVKNIVASLGTALTVEQIRVIRRYTTNITLVFDSDKAGQMAVLRALDLLLENDLQVRVVRLPEGMDPDSLIREKGKKAFCALLDECQDFFNYKLDVLKVTTDVNTIEGKANIAKGMLTTIAKLNSEVRKYEYIRKLASAINVKEEVLLAEFNKVGAPTPSRQPSLFKAKVNEPLSITEKILLKYMLTNKKSIPLLKKSVREEDFDSNLAKRVVTHFFNTYSDEESFSCSNIINTLDDKQTSGFIAKILMDDDIPMEKEFFKSSILKLRKNRAKVAREQLKNEIKNAEAEGNRDKLKVLVNKYDKINSEVRNG
ncbi:MAG: DNA primase [Candidatus Omnitrophica bacterium]|nr:DNA primase [Candidatus Omnitrophota bacterium]